MVVELTADSVRRANTATTTAVETATAWPSALRALYRYRVRELAHGMWLASAEQRDRSMDYWLAAEKHLRLLSESAAHTADARFGREKALAKTFEMFSPAERLKLPSGRAGPSHSVADARQTSSNLSCSRIRDAPFTAVAQAAIRRGRD